jgi:ATP-dependent Clp protease ATP-binding subunit ClpA
MREESEPLVGPMGVSLKRIVQRAIDEAVRRGAPNVEAEHLLLVISAGDDPAGRALAEVGLDHAGVEAALRQERERALAAAGVEPVAEERLQSTRRSRPGWGASFREALLRADFRARRDRSRDERERLAVASALLGILRADLGTVPRALAYAGVDRHALINRLEQL